MTTYHYIGVVLFVLGVVVGTQRKLMSQKLSKKGTVYFIYDESRDLVKIGMTKGSAYERMNDLQTGNPSDLTMVFSYVADDCRRAETWWHSTFREYKVRGEWYDAGPILHCISDGKAWAINAS